MTQPEAKPQFSQPVRQILSMLLALGLVAAGLVLGWDVLRGIFLSNPWLNSAISAFFVLGVLACFWQVIALIRSCRWRRCCARAGCGGTSRPTAPAQSSNRWPSASTKSARSRATSRAR